MKIRFLNKSQQILIRDAFYSYRAVHINMGLDRDLIEETDKEIRKLNI